MTNRLSLCHLSRVSFFNGLGAWNNACKQGDDKNAHHVWGGRWYEFRWDRGLSAALRQGKMQGTCGSSKKQRSRRIANPKKPSCEFTREFDGVGPGNQAQDFSIEPFFKEPPSCAYRRKARNPPDRRTATISARWRRRIANTIPRRQRWRGNRWGRWGQ